MPPMRAGSSPRARPWKIGLRKLRDQHVRSMVEDVLIRKSRPSRSHRSLAGCCREIVADNAHHGLVDLALEEGHRWLVHNQETFSDVIGERAPWWAPDRLNEVVTARLHLEAIRWVAGIRRDPGAPRPTGPGQPAPPAGTGPAHRLGHAGARREAGRLRVLEQPQMVTTGMSLWSAFRTALLDALEDEDGPLRDKAAAELVAFGEQVGRDACPEGEAGHLGRRLRCVGRSGATATSSPPSSRRPSSAGTARRRLARSSCTSVATCSSSGSTAPSSAGSWVCSSTRSRWCSEERN